MRKIIPFALFMFVVMAVCAWSIGWYMQSRAIKNEIATAMTMLDPAMGAIKASEVTTSGFPTRMIVTVQNPSLSLKLKQWLPMVHKRMAASTGNSAAVLTTPEYPEGTLDSAINGYVRFSINALSDVVGFEMSGTHSMQLTQPDASSAISTQYNGDTQCSTRLKRKGTALLGQMWDIQKFLSNEELLAEISAVQCGFPGATSTNTQNGQVIASMEPGSFSYTHELSDSLRNAGLKINMTGYEIMPAGDEFFSKLIQAFTPVNDQPMPVVPSLYGKQTLVFDGTAQLAADTKKIAEQPSRFEIKQIYFSSAAGTSNGSLLVIGNPSGNRQQGEFGISFESEFKPVQSQLAKMSVAQFADEAYGNGQFGKNIQHVDRTTFESTVYDALPDITRMGKIIQKMHLTYSGDKTTRDGSFTLSGFDFSTIDGGILADGTGSMAQNAMPAINATIICKNCTTLIDALAGYISRLDRASRLLSPEAGSYFSFTPEEVEAVKKILSELGIVENTADLKFVIESQASGMTINQQPIMQVMALAQKHLPQPAPPEPAP
jgi:hypothetical protein